MKRNQLVVSALAILVILSIVLMWRAATGRPNLVDQQEAVPLVPTPGILAAPVIAVDRQPVVETTAHEPRIGTLVALDAWARPIAGAMVFDDVDGAEWYRETDATWIGVTSAKGDLRFSIGEAPRIVHVGKPGLITQRVAVDAGAPTFVSLVEGGKVTLRCSSEVTGLPLPGVTVIVRSPAKPGYVEKRLQWDLIESSAIPAAPVEAAVFRVETGIDGIARFAGLVPGALGYHATSDDHILSSGPGQRPPDTSGIETGEKTYELRFLPVTACGFRVIGDTVVSERGNPVIHELARSVGISGRECGILQARLKSAYPGATFMVLPMCERLEMTFIFQEHGKHVINLPFRPIAEVRRDGPIVIDASTLPKDGTPIESVTVRIRNPDGSELRGVPFALFDEGSKPFSTMRSGVAGFLPDGRYEFVAMQGTMKASIEDRFVVVVDARSRRADGQIEAELHLTRTLRPVVLVLQQAGAGDVSAQRSDGMRAIIQAGASPERREAWLPVGEYEFRDGAKGDVLGRAKVESGSVEPLVVPLDATKR